MTEPLWQVEARKWIGQKEVPGPSSNDWLMRLWTSLRGGAWFWKNYGEDDSRLPWCGAFVAYAVNAAGLTYPANYASARAWAIYGQPLTNPAVGCIAVFERNGGGHVGFVIGTTPDSRLLILGGNQGDCVSIAPFDRARVIAYRWPANVSLPVPAKLPILASNAPLSTNEA